MRSESTMSRRRFLESGLFTAGVCILPRPLRDNTPDLLAPARALSFYNLHTGESLEAVYWSNGRYRPDALADINHILRDHRSGEIHAIDLNLLDLLHSLSQKLETRGPFQVVSGYRSQATNAMLQAQGRGVASGSLHMEGKAIDIRYPEVDLGDLRRSAIELSAGGVGYYPATDFVHVDVGRVRYW